MIINVFLCGFFKNTTVMKKTWMFFNDSSKKCNKIVSFKNHSFVISIFDKRIRISITQGENLEKDLQIINRYISNIIGNRKSIITIDGYDYFVDGNEIDLRRMWECTYENKNIK